MRTAAVNPSPALVERPATVGAKAIEPTQPAASAKPTKPQSDETALPLYSAAPELFGGVSLPTAAPAHSVEKSKAPQATAASAPRHKPDDGKALPLYEAAPELFGGFPLTPPRSPPSAPPAATITAAPVGTMEQPLQQQQQQQAPLPATAAPPSAASPPAAAGFASTVVAPPAPPVVVPMPFTTSSAGRAAPAPPPTATLGHGLPAAAPIPTPLRAVGEFNTIFAGATPLAPPRLTKESLEAASTAAAAAAGAGPAAIATAPLTLGAANRQVTTQHAALPVRAPVMVSSAAGTHFASGAATPSGFRATVPPSPAHAASTTYLTAGGHQEMILPLAEAAPELFGRDPAAATPRYTAVRSDVPSSIGAPSPVGAFVPGRGYTMQAAPSPWSMASASAYYPPTPANTTVSGSNLIMQQQQQQQYLRQFLQPSQQSYPQQQPQLQQQQQQVPRSWGPNGAATQQWLASQVPQGEAAPLSVPEGAMQTPGSEASGATSTSTSTAPVSRPVLAAKTPRSLREASELSSRSRSRSPAYRAMDTPSPSRGRFTGFQGTPPFEHGSGAALAPLSQVAAAAAAAAVNAASPVVLAVGRAAPKQAQAPQAQGGPLQAAYQENAPQRDLSESADLGSSALSQPKKKSRNARRNAARRLQKKTMSAAMAAKRHKSPTTMDLVAVQKSTPPLPLAAAQPSPLSQMAYKMLRPAAAPLVVYETPESAGVGKRDNMTEPPFAHM